MQKFIIKPDITFYPGIRVEEDTKLEFKNDKVEQTVENLKIHSIITEENEDYNSKTDLTVNLKVGDIIILDENRGYILPGIPLTTIEEEIEELSYLKEV